MKIQEDVYANPLLKVVLLVETERYLKYMQFNYNNKMRKKRLIEQASAGILSKSDIKKILKPVDKK